MEIIDDNDKILKLANGNQAIYELPVSAVLSITYTPGKKSRKINAGELLARIPLDFRNQKILQEDCLELQSFLRQENQKIIHLFLI